MPTHNYSQIIVQQLREGQRKLGITAAAFMPAGGLTGQVLAKNSNVAYDVSWQTILGPGGIYQIGNGLVLAGNTLHFAQAAAYTPGAVAFATGAATMGFDPTRLAWDNTAKQLAIVTDTPLNPAGAISTAATLNININANTAAEFYGVLVSVQHIGGVGNLTYDPFSQIYNNAGMLPMKSQNVVSGPVTVTGMAGWAVQNLVRSGATVTHAFGVLACAFLNDVGNGITVTNAYGVYVRRNRIIGAGATVGTQYAIFVDTMQVGGTLWGLYVQDTVAKNFFGGPVGIGMTPVRALDVTGTFGVTGAARLGSTLDVVGVTGLGIANSASTWLALGASTAGVSCLRITPGVAPAAPVSGDMWADSTERTLDFFYQGIERHVAGTIFEQVADQVIANTVVETTLFGAGTGTLTMPANSFGLRTTLLLELRGFAEKAAGNTIQIRAYLGGTLLLDTTALAPGNFTGQEYWRCSFKLTCRAIGVGGSVASSMSFEYHQGAGVGNFLELETIPSVVAINTTIAQTLNVTFTWGVAKVTDICTTRLGILTLT